MKMTAPQPVAPVYADRSVHPFWQDFTRSQMIENNTAGNLPMGQPTPMRVPQDIVHWGSNLAKQLGGQTDFETLGARLGAEERMKGGK
jgi:hypothetical protein